MAMSDTSIERDGVAIGGAFDRVTPSAGDTAQLSATARHTDQHQRDIIRIRQALLMGSFVVVSAVVFGFAVEYILHYRVKVPDVLTWSRMIVARSAMLAMPEAAKTALALCLAVPPAFFVGNSLRRVLWHVLIGGSVLMAAVCVVLAGAYQLQVPLGMTSADVMGPYPLPIAHLPFIVDDADPVRLAGQMHDAFWKLFTWYVGLISGLLGAQAVPAIKRLLSSEQGGR
ncbi:hypothetical protein V5740_07695 [Croceibacterium sp. TMG7-5b_MA50]|uniref:hypothetical protein n=1 Tax=Croceibacterium sp. TMG7-5b_MA50 TaxID=3121290 RepID=UPI003221E04A